MQMSKRRHPATPLGAFIRSRGLSVRLVAEGASISRQHLFRLRNGTGEPTRPVMVRVARACSRLSGIRVTVADLFDIETESDVDGINGS